MHRVCTPFGLITSTVQIQIFGDLIKAPAFFRSHTPDTMAMENFNRLECVFLDLQVEFLEFWR